MTLLLLAALAQFRYSGAVDSPAPPPPHAAAVADPFPARPVPPAWRVRRATVEAKPAPEPKPILGRSLAERVETLEYTIKDVMIALEKGWRPTPRTVALAADPPAVRGKVDGPPKAAMPPPGLADLGVILERLDAIEDKLATILARVEASAVKAAAPPAARTDNAPARMPAAATMPPLPAAPRMVVADRWVPANRVVSTPYAAQPYFAPATTYTFPLATYGGFGQQSPCIGPNCGQPQGLFGGLVGGRFR
jgi:hypothetical protein